MTYTLQCKTRKHMSHQRALPEGIHPLGGRPTYLVGVGALLRHAAVAALAWAACAAIAAPLDDIRRQVEGSQFEQAYKTAQTNPQLIGDVHFDFLYGVAAINVGKLVEGVLALERHLEAVPANDRARLELARGYFLMGEYTRARSEFEFILRFNPPAGVRNNIASFLQAMQVRDSADRRATARFYAEAGLGHDNNVNLGTFRDEVQLAFGPISLADSPSRQVADSYAQVAMGVQQLMRVSNRLSVFAGADVDHRTNFKQEAFDLTNFAGHIGFSQLGAGALWRATLGLSGMQVGGTHYRDALQLGAEAQLTLSQDLSAVAFTQYAEMRHAAADEVRDARSTTLGLMLTRNFPGQKFEPTVGVRFTYAQEDNQRLRRDLSKKTPVLRLFASATPMDRMRVSLGLTAYQENYGGQDLGFGSVRKDDAQAIDFVVSYALTAQWSLRGDAVWAVTRSNQDLYDKSRKAVSLKLRYQF